MPVIRDTNIKAVASLPTSLRLGGYFYFSRCDGVQHFGVLGPTSRHVFKPSRKQNGLCFGILPVAA